MSAPSPESQALEAGDLMLAEVTVFRLRVGAMPMTLQQHVVGDPAKVVALLRGVALKIEQAASPIIRPN